ncbi:MAG: hypothetical protein ACE10E_15400, partial [Acidiferrobacterales bacterium]
AGTLNLSEAANASLPNKGRSQQNWTGSTGVGSLEQSRGSSHLENNGVILSGEQDIFGMPFDTAIWAPMAARGTTWRSRACLAACAALLRFAVPASLAYRPKPSWLGRSPG